MLPLDGGHALDRRGRSGYTYMNKRPPGSRPAGATTAGEAAPDMSQEEIGPGEDDRNEASPFTDDYLTEIVPGYELMTREQRRTLVADLEREDALFDRYRAAPDDEKAAILEQRQWEHVEELEALDKVPSRIRRDELLRELVAEGYFASRRHDDEFAGFAGRVARVLLESQSRPELADEMAEIRRAVAACEKKLIALGVSNAGTHYGPLQANSTNDLAPNARAIRNRLKALVDEGADVQMANDIMYLVDRWPDEVTGDASRYTIAYWLAVQLESWDREPRRSRRDRADAIYEKMPFRGDPCDHHRSGLEEPFEEDPTVVVRKALLAIGCTKEEAKAPFEAQRKRRERRRGGTKR